MRLAVNIDHFATLREARKSADPDPVLVALLAEQAGAEAVVCHLRSDRRHIKERDLRLLRETVKTKLNLEMAATSEMLKVALEIKPDVVSLVPERLEELTTEGGLNVISNRARLAAFIKRLRKSGLRVSIFINPDIEQIKTAAGLGIDLIEINTGKYAEFKPGKSCDESLAQVRRAAECGQSVGLEIHAGHGLDYRNVGPIVRLPEISELSIGHSIVARAAVVGIEAAVRDMKRLLERG